MSRAVIRDADGQELDLDNSTGGVPTVDRFDVHLHAGNAYESSHTFNLLNGATGVIHIKTSANFDIHSIITGSYLGEGSIDIYENPTLTGDGTPVVAYNVNRESANTSETTIYHTPTETAPGTLLYSSVIPGGRITQASGYTGEARERMLKRSESYLAKFTNSSGATKDLTAIIEFYEETHNGD